VSDEIGRLERLVNQAVERLERSRAEQGALRHELDELRRNPSPAAGAGDLDAVRRRAEALEVVRAALAEIRAD